MTFTALHRAAGWNPGPITNALLDAAIEAQAVETDDLDWKSELPPAKGIAQTDFPKDVAAMANHGGGVIVYGVTETQKVATGRVDVGDFDEAHERALRTAAVTAITPPVLGLTIHMIDEPDRRAVVVEVPASVDGPHLIYKNDFFAAPLRNDADTVWMKERQIEAMYRARFDERRNATEALDRLYNEASAGRDTDQRAWLIAVAHPRLPVVREPLTRQEAQHVLSRTRDTTLRYADRGGIHPIESVDYLNPRPGLRRWVTRDFATGDITGWKASSMSIHHNASVTLATAIGGHRIAGGDHAAGWQVETTAVEAAVADLMALIRATAEATGSTEYDIRVGILWTGTEPLLIRTSDPYGHRFEDGAPLHTFTPVETSVNAAGAELDFHQQVHDLARDCVNQGGIANLRLIQQPPPARTT